MIDKFNFYDIYGYFLPGLALLGVLWLPFGITRKYWPAGDWGSTIIAVVLAYLVGHLMLYVTTSVIPSNDIKKSSERDRYPSDTVLDPDSSDLSADLRDKIAKAVDAQFGLNLHIDNGDGSYDKVRRDAFLLARQMLIQEKSATYAEQFQGMYSLARGLLAALAIGTVYFAGWVFSAFRIGLSFSIALGFVFLAMAVTVNVGCVRLRGIDGPKDTPEQRELLRQQKMTLERYYVASLLALFCSGGYLLGLGHEIHAGECALLTAAAVAALLGCLLCQRQYRTFAVRFATTVWLSFFCIQLKAKSNDGPSLAVE
jgi:hypothetical protein